MSDSLVIKLVMNYQRFRITINISLASTIYICLINDDDEDNDDGR